MGLKVGSWASDNGVPYVTPGASNTVTGSGCAKNMYGVYTSNTMLCRTIGEEMANIADTWYIFYSDYTWGHTAFDSITQILTDAGKQVVGSDAVPFPADDLTQYINNAAASNAEGLGLFLAGLDLRLATNQLINAGLANEIKLGTHQLEDIVYWGLSKEAASVVDVGGTAWTPALDTGQEWKERVAEQAESSPYVRHYMGYTAMDQIVRAAVRADSVNADEIRKEMEGHEITDSPVNDIKPGKLYWRECDHQLVQDTYLVEGMEPERMQNQPYKQWFALRDKVNGDEVVDSCEMSNCTF